jgi:phage/plasmid-like protein (TIGR03299 family)
MPAEVETMFSAGGQVPWHGLGTVVEDCLTSAEAVQTAGLDWTVSKIPAYARFPGAPNALHYQEVPTAAFTVRSDKQGIESVLGFVGTNYEPIQNHEAFQFADALVGGGQAFYETAGSLLGGRRVWMLLKLPGYVHIENSKDVIGQYLCVMTGHDGGCSLRAMVTPVRVVCMNTLNLALSGVKASFFIRHTTNSRDRVQEARVMLGLTVNYFEQFGALANALNRITLTPTLVEQYLEIVVPTMGLPDGRKTNNARAEQQAIRQTLESETCLVPGIEGTAWSLLNAITETADWRRLRGDQAQDDPRTESRLMYQWWGGGLVRKQRALNAMLSMTGLAV